MLGSRDNALLAVGAITTQVRQNHWKKQRPRGAPRFGESDATDGTLNLALRMEVRVVAPPVTALGPWGCHSAPRPAVPRPSLGARWYSPRPSRGQVPSPVSCDAFGGWARCPLLHREEAGPGAGHPRDPYVTRFVAQTRKTNTTSLLQTTPSITQCTQQVTVLCWVSPCSTWPRHGSLSQSSGAEQQRVCTTGRTGRRDFSVLYPVAGSAAVSVRHKADLPAGGAGGSKCQRGGTTDHPIGHRGARLCAQSYSDEPLLCSKCSWEPPTTVTFSTGYRKGGRGAHRASHWLLAEGCPGVLLQTLGHGPPKAPDLPVGGVPPCGH